MTEAEIRAVVQKVLQEEGVGGTLGARSKITFGLLLACLGLLVPGMTWLIRSHYGLREEWSAQAHELQARVGVLEMEIRTNRTERIYEFGQLRRDFTAMTEAMQQSMRDAAISAPDRWTATMMQGWADRLHLYNATNELIVPDVRQVTRDYPLPKLNNP